VPSKSHAPFAVFNRTANPLLRLVLRSPLHAPVGRRLALITVIGRHSGRRYTFPVGYEQSGDHVKITVGWPERKRCGGIPDRARRSSCAFGEWSAEVALKPRETSRLESPSRCRSTRPATTAA
jgi:hypothetical protein